MKVEVPVETEYDAKRVVKRLRGTCEYRAGSGLVVVGFVDPAKYVKAVHPYTAVSRYPNTPQEDAIADMLRYDVAFWNPKQPEIVLTLKYTTPGSGSSTGRPTLARWASFGIQLLDAPGFIGLDVLESDPDGWVTYAHEGPMYKLQRQSFREWLGRLAVDR